MFFYALRALACCDPSGSRILFYRILPEGYIIIFPSLHWGDGNMICAALLGPALRAPLGLCGLGLRVRAVTWCWCNLYVPVSVPIPIIPACYNTGPLPFRSRTHWYFLRFYNLTSQLMLRTYSNQRIVIK